MTTPLALQQIRKAPKALLHDHLDGGLRPSTVLDIAGQTGYDELPATEVDELATWCNDRNRALQAAPSSAPRPPPSPSACYRNPER